MDGRFPKAVHFIAEVAMKTWVSLTMLLLATLASFAGVVESDNPAAAHVVFYVT